MVLIAERHIASQVPAILLAKSERGGRQVSLQEHLLDTERAAQLIFRIDGRWERNWCRFFGLCDSGLREKFILNLRVASLFHDLGKANEDFYHAVAQGQFFQQKP